MATSFYHKLVKRSIVARHVAEIGVYHPQTSNVFEFILQGIKTTLVEADPDIAKLLKHEFENHPNVSIYNVAIYDKKTTIKFVRKGSSSFVSDLQNVPAVINDGVSMEDVEYIEVPAITFDEIDPGDIDILSVDIEGAEWFVLKHMISRPKVISIETHGGLYVNPFLPSIQKWMRENNYSVWYKTNSDTIFIKNSIIDLNILDKMRLFFQNRAIALRRVRKQVKKQLRAPIFRDKKRS